MADKESEIDQLNRRIVTLSAFVESKDKVLKQVQNELNKIISSSIIEKEALISVQNLIRKNLESELEHDFITYHFEEVHPHFYQKLNTLGGTQLTHKDLRLAVFLKMELRNKEIAFILNLTHDGVKKAIQRLRKKLSLSANDDLRRLIRSL